MQEKRFHTLFDGKLDAAVAQKLAQRANAEARIVELEGTLKAFNKPSRSVEAIEAELRGYEARSDAEKFPTRITSLKAELRAAQSYAMIAADLGAQRKTLEDTAALAAERLDARKVGQDFRLFGTAVPADISIWLLIATMLAIKSLGPWLLIGGREKAEVSPEPVQPAEDTDWTYVERTDRQGRVRRVKVARADAA
jgi:DNA-binding transcriptional regulator YdaS (Cro superfamily)